MERKRAPPARGRRPSSRRDLSSAFYEGYESSEEQYPPRPQQSGTMPPYGMPPPLLHRGSSDVDPGSSFPHESNNSYTPLDPYASYIPPPPYFLPPVLRQSSIYGSQPPPPPQLARSSHYSGATHASPYGPSYYEQFRPPTPGSLVPFDELPEEASDGVQVDFSALQSVRNVPDKSASTLMPSVDAVTLVCANVSRVLYLRTDDLQSRAGASTDEIESTASELSRFAMALGNLREVLEKTSRLISHTAFENINTLLLFCKKALQRIQSVITASKKVPSRLNFLKRNSLNSSLAKVKPVRLNLECLKTSLTAMTSTINLAGQQAKHAISRANTNSSETLANGENPNRSSKFPTTTYELDGSVERITWKLEDDIYANSRAIRKWQQAEQGEFNNLYIRGAVPADASPVSPASQWISKLVPFQPIPSNMKRIAGPEPRRSIAYGNAETIASSSKTQIDEEEEQARVAAVIQILLTKWTQTAPKVSYSNPAIGKSSDHKAQLLRNSTSPDGQDVGTKDPSVKKKKKHVSFENEISENEEQPPRSLTLSENESEELQNKRGLGGDGTDADVGREANNERPVKTGDSKLEEPTPEASATDEQDFERPPADLTRSGPKIREAISYMNSLEATDHADEGIYNPALDVKRGKEKLRPSVSSPVPQVFDDDDDDTLDDLPKANWEADQDYEIRHGAEANLYSERDAIPYFYSQFHPPPGIDTRYHPQTPVYPTASPYQYQNGPPPPITGPYQSNYYPTPPTTQPTPPPRDEEGSPLAPGFAETVYSEGASRSYSRMSQADRYRENGGYPRRRSREDPFLPNEIVVRGGSSRRSQADRYRENVGYPRREPSPAGSHRSFANLSVGKTALALRVKEPEIYLETRRRRSPEKESQPDAMRVEGLEAEVARLVRDQEEARLAAERKEAADERNSAAKAERIAQLEERVAATELESGTKSETINALQARVTAAGTKVTTLEARLARRDATVERLKKERDERNAPLAPDPAGAGAPEQEGVVEVIEEDADEAVEVERTVIPQRRSPSIYSYYTNSYHEPKQDMFWDFALVTITVLALGLGMSTILATYLHSDNGLALHKIMSVMHNQTAQVVLQT